jgi:hypothetical protein
MKTALIVFASIIFGFTHAQVSLAAPTIYMQSATINGASNVITVSRVPVLNGAGVITYKDISMGFIVDTLGNVTFNNAALRIVASPVLNVGAFKPGTYYGYSGYNDGHTFKVGAPGVGTGGRISGSISRITSISPDIFNASWTSGPIAGHPHQAKLTAAGITSTAFNWGVMGTAGGYTQEGGWKAGDIIGTVQNGNQLSIVNYGIDNKADATLTFDLCPTANPC